MRICQVMIGEGFGGAERSFVDTALAMADRGHAVQAVCHRDFAKRSLLEDHGGITVSPVVVRGAWDLWAVHRMKRVIAGFQPDVMHTHLARGSWLGGQAGRALGIPVVAKLHNYANLKYYRFVDGFIATTNDQGRYLSQNGVSENCRAIIPNFSRMPVRPTPEKDSSASGDPVHFVTCGRLHTVKGYDVLLYAMSILKNRGITARLTIGGDGPERESLLGLRRALDLDDLVTFAGWTDDPIPLLDSGDVYVLSSRTESFGIALLEAMARGLPAVSTRCQGPLELLTEDTCWFAAAEDAQALAGAMSVAIGDSQARETHARQLNQQFVERYAEDRVVPQILEFYATCLAQRTIGRSQAAA